MRKAFNKSIIAITAITLLSLACVISCSQKGNITVAKKDKSAFAIVLSSEASPSEKHAAEELQSHINLATGAELSIVTETDSRASQPGRIFIGMSEAAKKADVGDEQIDLGAFGDEGFVIRNVGTGKKADIMIIGGRLRGTMYGVYSFLEHLGFRWYTKRVTRFPEGKILSTVPFHISDSPDFMSRDTTIKEARDPDWAARNRMNAGHAKLGEERGGSIRVNGVHTLERLVPSSYYETNPEYFPLIGGERVTGLVQRCMSNPELVDIAVKKW